MGGVAIGLLVVAAANSMGAPEVSLEARYPHQIKVGERLETTRASGAYDVVLDAAGTGSALSEPVDGATDRPSARRS